MFVGQSLHSPDTKRLEVVLRCTTCKQIVEDRIGPVEGEEAHYWLERHLKESPRCA